MIPVKSKPNNLSKLKKKIQFSQFHWQNSTLILKLLIWGLTNLWHSTNKSFMSILMIIKMKIIGLLFRALAQLELLQVLITR